MSAQDAFKAAGYKPHRGNSFRLSVKLEVTARVQELLGFSAEKVVEKLVIDREWIVSRLADLHEKAMKAKQFSPAARALELLGKDFGMFKERIELGGHIQVQNTELYRKMTTDERQAMRQLLIEASARPIAANDDDEPQGGVVPALTADDAK